MKKRLNILAGVFAGILMSVFFVSWIYPATYAASSSQKGAAPKGTKIHAAAPTPPPAMSISQVQSLYSAIASVPATPTAFVNAYMQALSTGSGLYARAYLTDFILRQIPLSVGPRIRRENLGLLIWITKWKITFNGYSAKGYSTENIFTVTAFGPLGSPDSSANVGALFRDKLSVFSLNVANPTADTRPYVIGAQTVTWLHPRFMNHF